MPSRRPIALALAITLLLASGFAARAASPGPIAIRVESGKYARHDTPVHVSILMNRLGPEVVDRLRFGPVALRLTPDDASSKPLIAQAERVGSTVRLSWVIPGPIAAGRQGTYQLDVVRPVRYESPWRINKVKLGEELRHGDRLVFRYNNATVSSPAYGPIQDRDSYIHPAYAPSGALVTGDFSPFHPHHRGFFLAYAKARAGDQLFDFWNIHTDRGKVRHEGTDTTVNGPMTAQIRARHRWDDKSGDVVLRERWDLEAIDVPGAPYWLFDLTSTQLAVSRPFEVLPYRYGGMAYRGPEPFVKGKLDVLNSEGKHRIDGNLQPTRWVDLTGPVADGSSTYAGAMIADHPGNIHHPTVARIHPITLPFFSFVPASDTKVVIATETPLVFRYRVLIHDGHPDAGLDERIWHDFAEPPRVTIGVD